MRAGAARADPPVEISVPNAFTSRVQRIVSGRRGQILGYDAKPDWPGWDVVSAHMPQSELHDLIVELRSVTLGVGTFADRFDHLQELTGKAGGEGAGLAHRRRGAVAPAGGASAARETVTWRPVPPLQIMDRSSPGERRC